MKIPCKHCCQSGNVVEYIGPPIHPSSTAYHYPFNHAIGSCPYCKGTGWIDDEDKITVERKYIKDEYFKHQP